MSLLLDTQVFLWFESGSAKLGDFVRRTIGRERDVYVSAASFLEIAIKQQAGKLALEGSPRAAALAAGFSELAIGGADAETARVRSIGTIATHSTACWSPIASTATLRSLPPTPVCARATTSR